MTILGTASGKVEINGHEVTFSQFKKDVERSDLKPEDRKAALARFKEMAVEQEVARMRERQKTLSGSIIEPTRNFLLRQGNRITFDQGARLAGLFSENEGFRTEVGLEAAQRATPKAALAGDVTGLMTGPGAMGLRAAGRLAEQAGARAVRPVLEMTPQVARGWLQGRAATAVARGYAQGIGGLTALRLTEDSDKALVERWAQVGSDLENPLFHILTVGTAAMSARAMSVNTPEERRFLMDLRREARELGRRELTPDLAVGDHTLNKAIDLVRQRDPRRAARLADITVRSWNRLTARLADELGATGGDAMGASRQAAAAARRLAGTRVEQSAVVATRRATQEVAAQQELTRPITDPAVRRQLARVIAAETREQSKRMGGLGSEMKTALRNFGSVYRNAATGKGRPLDLQDIEDMIGSLDGIARFNRGMGQQLGAVTQADVRVAARLSTVLRAQRDALTPEYARVQNWAAGLRRQEEALKSLTNTSELDDLAARAFWSGPQPITKWRSALEHGTPQDIGALRGWLFWNFQREIVSNTRIGVPIHSVIQKSLRSAGPTHRQIMDEVFPGLADEMVLAARVFERSRAPGSGGILSNAGSETGRRLDRGWAEQIIGSPLSWVAFSAATFGGYQYNGIQGAATGVGVIGMGYTLKTLTEKWQNALLAGRRGDMISRAALEGRSAAIPAAAGAQALPALPDNLRNLIGGGLTPQRSQETP